MWNPGDKCPNVVVDIKQQVVFLFCFFPSCSKLKIWCSNAFLFYHFNRCERRRDDKKKKNIITTQLVLCHIKHPRCWKGTRKWLKLVALNNNQPIQDLSCFGILSIRMTKSWCAAAHLLNCSWTGRELHSHRDRTISKNADCTSITAALVLEPIGTLVDNKIIINSGAWQQYFYFTFIN